MRRLHIARAVAVATCLVVSSTGTAQEIDRAMTIEREMQRIARDTPLWPGFDPIVVPLAVFTGEHTYLFRHPSPPDGFAAARGTAMRVHAYRGRHPAVTSNSSARIGDVVTATLLADARRASQSATVLAAVALHEAFHVHQRARHPRWIANEGDLLLYPFDDAAVLGLRRLESEALRRAVAARDSSLAACWSRQAMAARAQRFAVMDSAFVAYERLSELNEGLASYIQMRAGGYAVDTIPESGFGATAVRHRVYAVGPAIGMLLDRLDSTWKEELSRTDTVWLDALFSMALGPAPSPDSRCEWTEPERRRIEQVAHADASAVVAERAQRRRAFDALPGWRLIVRAAAGRPLWPQGFDPLNMQQVVGGVLHTRFVKLGNDDAEMRSIDEGAADLSTLTVGAGAHPLFNGVREVTIAGFGEPEIQRGDSGHAISIRAAGLDATFTGAAMDQRGQTIIVRLGSDP